MDKVTAYFSGDEMASHVWQGKYQMKDANKNPLEETPADMHKRLAREFAKVEFDYKEKEEILCDTQQKYNDLSTFGKRLYDKRIGQGIEHIEAELFTYFDKFSQIVPQGSIMSNLGNDHVFGSLSNCFGIAPPEDSYGGILRTDEEMVQLMKRRGGVGFPLSLLRPKNTAVTNAAKSSSGVASFAERFSNSTREVAQEGRRGALMLLLHCQHPDIFQFVRMKDDRTKVTGANVSVMFTDNFMMAAEVDDDFICSFPIVKDEAATVVKLIEGDCGINNLKYNELHTIRNVLTNDGTRIYVMKIKAKELFDLVVEMAHKNAEPGVAYIDRITDYSPDGVYEMYMPELCNPCGEQWFHRYDTCRLIALNLFSIIDNPFTKERSVNFEKLYEMAYMQQRLGDDLVDLELKYIGRIMTKILNDPEDEKIKRVELNLWEKIYDVAKGGRRTGNGFTALADMIASMLTAYADSESIVEEVMRVKMQAELDATIDMAILRGTFTGWDRELEFGYSESPAGFNRIYSGANSFFEMIAREFPQQAEKMYQYGRRNVSWSTVAPTGTVSLMTQTTSGLEPLFKAFYIRRKKINPFEEGSRVDFMDQNGDTWQEYAILHPKFKQWITTAHPHYVEGDIPELSKKIIQEIFEESPWYKSEADDISWQARIKINAIIQKYTSNALSCTINLPADVPKETVANIYFEGWKQGLKGVTVYRDGSRSGVLVTENSIAKKDEFGYTDSVKRPKELEAEYHFATSKGKEYAIVVGLFEGMPYELFAFENPVQKEAVNGKIIKVKKGVYKFESLNYNIDNLQITSEHNDERLLTRFVSGMLRHGMNPKHIAEQVEKSEVQIVNFAKVISRVLKRYIPDEVTGEKCPECEDGQLVYQEGCKRCSSCGFSKC